MGIKWKKLLLHCILCELDENLNARDTVSLFLFLVHFLALFEGCENHDHDEQEPGQDDSDCARFNQLGMLKPKSRKVDWRL